MLDAVESFESYTLEEQADIIVQYYRSMMALMGLEPFLENLRQFALTNPDFMENIIAGFKSTNLQKLREAIKQRRRTMRITRR